MGKRQVDYMTESSAESPFPDDSREEEAKPMQGIVWGHRDCLIQIYYFQGIPVVPMGCSPILEAPRHLTTQFPPLRGHQSL
jgi:hypothetical protein